MKKIFFVFISLTVLLLFSTKKTLAQGSYLCAQPNPGKCMLVNNCEEGYAPSNPDKCDKLMEPVSEDNPGIAFCSADLTEETCIPQTNPIGFRCNLGLKVCEKGCEYGIDPGCNYAEDQEATCNTECALSSSPLDWGCNETTGECERVEPGTGKSFEVCTPACAAAFSRLGIEMTCTTSEGLLGIDSAVGCIPIETNVSLWQFILRWAIGIAGGIAFLLMLYAGFLLITSSGHPKKIQAGKELLISAITGLILLISAVWLLRVIGADILKIFI